MKINLPVSGRAVEFSVNANILSTTNPKGAITYVNPDFINISGFSEAELLGVNPKSSLCTPSLLDAKQACCLGRAGSIFLVQWRAF